MGVMTLAMSVFSIVPMSISLTNRVYLSRVISYMLEKYGRPTGENQETQEQFDPIEFWGTASNILKTSDDLPPEDDSRVVRLASAMLIFFIVCIILLLVYLVCSIMLMYGSAKNSRWMILPWLVATFLFIIAYIAGMILSTYLFGVSHLSIAFLSIAIIESCIALYFWLCIIARFQELADSVQNDKSNSRQIELPRLNTSYNHHSYKGLPTDER